MPDLGYARFPFAFKEEEGTVVGYANKAIVDDGRDLIPAEVWFSALTTFFKEGTPVKLLHRPGLVVGETLWLKVAKDGLILASRPIPEVLALIRRGLLNAYSIGFIPKDVEYREDGVRVIKDLDLVEVSYVDVPMNPGCYFAAVKMRMDHEVIFDKENRRVVILGVSPEEMAELTKGLKELLLKAGVPEGEPLAAVEFKMAEAPKAEPAPAEPSPAESPAPEPASPEEVDWEEVFEVYYKELAGEEVPEEKKRWSRRYINSLPDSSFAVIEPAYERGETKDKNCRHLPHHGPGGGGTKNVNLDLPHLRNAYARANQIKPVTDSISTEELRRRAMEHLEHHRSALTTYQGDKSELLARVETLAASVREAQAKSEEAAGLRTEIEGLKGKLGEFGEALEAMRKEQAELRSALATLVEVVQSIVPPQKSKPVLDTTGERKVSKWGIFSR